MAGLGRKERLTGVASVLWSAVAKRWKRGDTAFEARTRAAVLLLATHLLPAPSGQNRRAMGVSHPPSKAPSPVEDSLCRRTPRSLPGHNKSAAPQGSRALKNAFRADQYSAGPWTPPAACSGVMLSGL